MNSRHSASGQAAGYQYQAEQALLTLVRRKQPRLTLFMERLDDFEVVDDANVLDVVNAKHHLRDADLTDRSVDLWRTLNAWITVRGSLEADEVASFILLTTATAAQGSIAALLRQDAHRNPELAEVQLLRVAESDGAETTRKWRRRFAALAEDERRTLVSAITVADQQPQLPDLDEEIRREFAPTVRSEHLEAFVSRLRGWWFDRVARMLTGRLPGVAVEDLWHFLQELRDGFSLDNLPFVHEVPEPTDEEGAQYSASTFTAQLRLVDVTDTLIAIAIRDYHRAYANTSRWAREGLLQPGELTSYEMRIVEEWERRFESMRQELGDAATDAAMRAEGRRLWIALDQNLEMPTLRARLEEPTIFRGTLHTLSDDERVGWHPEFRERLRELVAELSA
jgi:hypothetical protein